MEMDIPILSRVKLQMAVPESKVYAKYVYSICICSGCAYICQLQRSGFWALGISRTRGVEANVGVRGESVDVTHYDRFRTRNGRNAAVTTAHCGAGDDHRADTGAESRRTFGFLELQHTLRGEIRG